MPTRRLTELGLAVAEALEHVHSQGLVHRDVKPANVMVGRGGKTKLTDFGIARLVDAAKVTSTGLMVGTASYLAPEQVSGEPVGPPADVYALGLVLLEAFTGVREYEGPAVEAAMARLHRAPSLPATLPAGWAALLTAMTDRQASQRPTAGEVARVLRGMLGGQTTTVLAQPTVVAQQPTRAIPVQPVVVPRKSYRGVWITIAFLVALGAGAAGVLATQGKATPRTVPPVSTDVPDPLNKDLNNFVKQVTGP
jgi:serine/threonine protein kinase